MVGAAWRSTCFAPSRESRSNWTAASILATRTHTGGIVARMRCSRRTATWSSGSLPKTLANISIKFWMQSCGLCHITTPEPDGYASDSHNSEAGKCSLIEAIVESEKAVAFLQRATMTLVSMAVVIVHVIDEPSGA